ncbi:hypothetical protein A7X67_16235 [Clostridium sp. W14A]|nr:hypothetical protein A7X67_16235 [Clostridium sp. W14A]
MRHPWAQGDTKPNTGRKPLMGVGIPHRPPKRHTGRHRLQHGLVLHLLRCLVCGVLRLGLDVIAIRFQRNAFCFQAIGIHLLQQNILFLRIQGIGQLVAEILLYLILSGVRGTKSRKNAEHFSI